MKRGLGDVAGASLDFRGRCGRILDARGGPTARIWEGCRAVGNGNPVKPERASRLFSLPSTRVGKWSSALLAISFVLVVLNTAVVQPITEARVGLHAAQSIYNVVVGLFVVGSGISGLYAVVLKRERSWTVILAVLILTAVIILMVQDLATPGQ